MPDPIYQALSLPPVPEYQYEPIPLPAPLPPPSLLTPPQPTLAHPGPLEQPKPSHWQQYLAQQQETIQQQTQEALQRLRPWNQPGWARMANPLLSRSAVPQLAQTDPQAGTLPYFMGNDQGGAGTNPMLLQMLMGGAGGAL